MTNERSGKCMRELFSNSGESWFLKGVQFLGHVHGSVVHDNVKVNFSVDFRILLRKNENG